MKRRQFTLSDRDRQTLENFMHCPVPKKYFELNALGDRYDFNYNYEEIYDYADVLLHGQEIDLRHNFVGMPAVAVNEDFRKLLDVLARRNPTVENFCEKCSEAIEVLLRAAQR